MTNEELQAHIDAINIACARGEVEYRSHHKSEEWMPRTHGPIAGELYRIRAQPRDYWLRIDRTTGRATQISDNAEDAKAWDNIKDMGSTVHFREVIE